MDTVFRVMFVAIITFVVPLFVVIPVVEVVGIHIGTGGGDHTGYITSVEKTGLFFKTGTAYLKTSTQSTQEDAYCVIDDAVYSQLQEDSISGVQVNVTYHSVIAAGIKECNGEAAIIDAVKTL